MVPGALYIWGGKLSPAADNFGSASRSPRYGKGLNKEFKVSGSDGTTKITSDQAKRCTFYNQWTLEDTIQTPLHQGKWGIRAASHCLI